MEENERTYYDKIKDIVNAYLFHDPNAQAATAYDREKKRKTVDEKTFAMFKESAEAGHPFSCFNLGRCYENGAGVEKDLEQAYEWYRKAASSGDVNAWMALARMFDTGTYVDRDAEQAVMWLERAAEKGHPIAMIGLGQKYTRGEGVERDHKRALALFTAAQEKDKRYGSYILGEAIGDGIGCEKNYEKAFALFQEAHANDFPLATFNLGMMLEMGLGCEKDEKKGFELILDAADKGIPEAMYRIAFHYREGTGGAQADDKKAFEYFKAAADKGFVLADVETGLCYENGYGVEVSKEEAFRYYEKGAQAGNHSAIVCLAVCYRAGIGCEPDVDKAMELMEVGVRMGNTRAYHLMAVALLEEDPYDERAMNMEMVAARSGFARSSLFLGGFYLQNSDVGPDRKRAEHYFRLAAREGNHEAEFELADLLDTPENAENEEIRKEVDQLYMRSADSGHPLAAYRVACACKKDEQTPETIRKQVHYMCIASAGAIPEATEDIARRSFWGDEIKVDLSSACGLYHYSAEELNSDSLMAMYAYCQILLIRYPVFCSFGLYTRDRKGPSSIGHPRDPASNERLTESMKLLTDLEEKKVPEAMLFLPIARILAEGSDLSSEEDLARLTNIQSLPDSREKLYVQGILSAALHPEHPHEAIRILEKLGKEYQGNNVDHILGNLYFSLAEGSKKFRHSEQIDATPLELMTTAAEHYREAVRTGQHQDTGMYCLATEKRMQLERKKTYYRTFGFMSAMIPVATILIVLFKHLLSEENEPFSWGDLLYLLGMVAAWTILAAIVLVVAIEIYTQVILFRKRKKLEKETKKRPFKI